MQKIVVPDVGKSQIMPAVTVRIPMPQGAAVPAQTGGPQAAPQAAPAAAPAPQTAQAQTE